jgi:hypothetical protein
MNRCFLSLLFPLVYWKYRKKNGEKESGKRPPFQQTD